MACGYSWLRSLSPQRLVVEPSIRKCTVPFYASQAKQHQDAWANHLNVPVELSTEIGLKFSLIPPVEFDMGSTQAEVDALLATPTNAGWVNNNLKTMRSTRLHITASGSQDRFT